MANGAHPLLSRRRRAGGRLIRLTTRLSLVMAVALVAAVFGGASYLGGVASSTAPDVLPVAVPRPPAAAVSVLAGPSAEVAAGVAGRLFSAAPVVVVASATDRAALAAAAADALRNRAPMLLAPDGLAWASRRQRTAVLGEILALRPEAVLTVGISGPALAAGLPGIRVVSKASALPATGAAAALHHVALLVPAADGAAAAVVTAAVTTARAAGAHVIVIPGGDPRTDPAAIASLASLRPRQVLAVGAGFGQAPALAARIAVAETGVQLPGGGQVVVPMHRLVALYGHPGIPGLGALGEQGLTASIARVKAIAARYQPLSSVPVIPAFEIIATIAEGSPGPDGLYSYQTPVATMRPWVRQANAAGLYVILDLQAGRANLLAQAERYQSLLRLPDVGLALDPEWKLQSGQLPLHQIGSVTSAQVNAVISWLAALTARYHLPQKLLVLHQFRLSMLAGEAAIDTRNDDLAIVVHMDGQGTPADKFRTWAAVTAAAPPRVYFGWKNFFVKDHPMLTPGQTMAQRPQPVMISYQ